MNRTAATCIAGTRSKTTSRTRIHFFPRPREAERFTRVPTRGRSVLRGFGLGIFAKRLRWRPSATRRDDGQLDARDRPRVTFAGDFSGMIPEPTGTTAVAANPGYAKLFAELGAGSLAVGIALVVLISFLRKLITDKAETLPIEAATVVPVA